MIHNPDVQVKFETTNSRHIVECDLMRLKGIYRAMCYEYWQSLGISNTYQLTMTQIESEPESLRLMDWMFSERTTSGSLDLPGMRAEIADDFNSGRRI